MMGTAAIIVVADARKGHLPSPRAVLGLGFVYIALAGLADVAGGIAGPLALLVLAGVLLKEGVPALTSFSNVLTGHGTLGVPNTPQTVQLSPATTVGGAVPAGDVPPSPAAARAVAMARTAIGAPYVFGGASLQSGFDCSGLCQWAYRLAGVSIPRTSEEQAAAGFARVTEGNWSPGDLVFSDWGDGQPSPGHVVMYAGGGQCIAAPRPGTRVQYEPISTFLGAHYRGSSRPAPTNARA
jgi:cell wall-associated NlpC family hydrolase